MPSITLTKSNVVTRDTYVEQAYPTATTGATASTLSVGGGNGVGANIRPMIFFDLGLIPNDAIINSATLSLYQMQSQASRVLNIHKITQNWDNSSTWNTQPTIASTPYASPTIGNTLTTYNIDIKTLVQEWVNGQSPNYGLMIKDADETTINVRKNFYSFDNASNSPTLTIDYTIPSTGKKQVEYVGNGGLVNQSTPVANYTMPIPASAQVGDLLVAQFTTGNASNVSLPTGWMPLVKDHNTNISQSFVIAYKTKAASEPSPTFTSATATIWAGTMHVFRNVKAVKTGMFNRLSSNINCSPPATSTDVDKTAFVLFNNNTSGATFTPPLNYSEIAEILGGSTGVLQASMRYMYSNRSQSSAEMTSVASVAVNGISASMVLEPIVNNPPTITLTSPADNQTLVEGNAYEISGSASESDVGNVVTVKYKIDDGQTYNITAGVSDGTTPINFNKTLTYLNNRLYDGQTAVTPILDDQVTHTLTVWAEDDQGGKSTEVTRNFTVLYNQPPQISGSDQDLGATTEPPSIQYSVTDIEGYSFTITEAVNGQTIRTFPGVDEQQETLEIPDDMWIRLQPGVTHSLTITATDQYGATSTRTYTFTRVVDGIELMTTQILPADEQPSRVILSLNGTIPTNANLSVLVCNNALDTEPTWEDMTDSVKNKRPYVFTNTTSTSGQWGIQFKISILPGA